MVIKLNTMENSGIKWGIIGAISTVVISLLTYMVGPKFYLQGGSWIGLIALLVFMVMAGREERSKQGGFLNFQEALKPIFLCFIITTFSSTVLQILMYKVIDPSLAETTKQIAIEGIQKLKNFLGEEGYEKAMEGIESQDFSSIRQYVVGFATNILLGFGFSALVALFIKKNRPENYYPPTEPIDQL